MPRSYRGVITKAPPRASSDFRTIAIYFKVRFELYTAYPTRHGGGRRGGAGAGSSVRTMCAFFTHQSFSPRRDHKQVDV